MILGAVLITSALLLLLYNKNEDSQAGQAAEAVIPELQDVITENQAIREVEPTVMPHIDLNDKIAVERSYEMTVSEIDGHGYIGYISIPVLELELPIMAESSYPKLKIAPCRQFGTVKGRDLIIAGHNYARHFGYLTHLKQDDVLIFTDMNGETTVYSMLEIEILEATQVKEMQSGEWDLTLYTCTYGGKRRIAVRFVQIESD